MKIKENDDAYIKGNFYFCPSGYNPVNIITHGSDTFDLTSGTFSDYFCIKSSEYYPNGRYLYYNKDEEKNYYSAPEFLQFPGEIVFYDQDATVTDSDRNTVNIKRYYISEVRTAPIASLEDGTFVIDSKTCKSGFAVYYIGDESLSRPSYYNDDSNGQKYYRCVSVEEVDQKRCLIKYNLDDNDITLSISSSSTSAESETIDIVLEMFEKFKDKMSKCTSNKYDEEPITCGRKDLRKYAYFYENPDEYLLYKDENQIIDYIIQDHYGSSSYLMINLIFLLFLFFL